MDTEEGDERREYDHGCEEERGEHERGSHGSEERSESDRDQKRDEHGGDHDGEEGGGTYDRGEDREQHQETGGEEDGRENNGYCFPYTTKRWPRPRHRDIRHVNYAFGEPHVDVAEREAQDWLDNLHLAEEEENDPTKIRQKGPKYRSGTTNESPQMQERLQRCEQDQERHEWRKHIPRLEKRNESGDIYPVLHLDENENERKPEKAVPLRLWGNTRRSAVGNNSASVYAVMHPSSENGDNFKKKTRKISRNYLKDHRVAIAEMSAMVHVYKQKESEEETRRLAATKFYDGRNCPTIKFQKRLREYPDFVERNMEAIAEQSQHAREIREFTWPDNSYKPNRGKVPQYLLQRKRELVEQAEEREHEQDVLTIPKGRKMMSEAERLQTVENLEQRHKQLIKVLKSFPLIYDTAHQIRLKSEIDQELKEVEASHSYYNNPRVYLSKQEPHPREITSAKNPLSPQRRSNSTFPHLDYSLESIAPRRKTKTPEDSPHGKSNLIPMTYSNNRCDTCFAQMQRPIKTPAGTRKPLRCIACTLKLQTRNRSLWALKKPVRPRAAPASM